MITKKSGNSPGWKLLPDDKSKKRLIFLMLFQQKPKTHRKTDRLPFTSHHFAAPTSAFKI